MNVWTLLVDDHDLPHVLKTRIHPNHIVKWRLVVLGDAWKANNTDQRNILEGEETWWHKRVGAGAHPLDSLAF